MSSKISNSQEMERRLKRSGTPDEILHHIQTTNDRKNITQGTLIRIATQANLTHTNITQQALSKKFIQTEAKLQKNKTNHKEYREKILQDLAEEYSVEGPSQPNRPSKP